MGASTMNAFFQTARARYADHLKRHYFKPAHAQSLNIFRVLFCGVLAWTVFRSGPVDDALLARGIFNPVPTFQWFGIGMMSAEWLVAWRVILVAALCSATIGFLTRSSMTVSWIAYYIYMGTLLSCTKSEHSNYVYHSKNICIVVLIILAAAPHIAMWGVDGLRRRGWRWKLPDPSMAIVSAWPSQLIVLSLALAYFGAGYCKILKGFVLWADGYTLQAHLLAKHLAVDSPAAVWLAEQYWLCVVISIVTLVLELAFVLIVFYPRLTWLFVIGGLGFHIGVLWLMKINFLVYFGFVYFIFLDWPTVLRITAPIRNGARGISAFFSSKRSPGADDAPVLSEGTALGYVPWARNFVIGVATVLIGCIVFRIERWPLTDYRVYADRHHHSRVRIYRVAGFDENGQRYWLTDDEMPASRTTLNRNFSFADGTQDYEVIDDIMDKVAEELPAIEKQDYHSVAVLRRTVTMDEQGKYTFRDEALSARTMSKEEELPTVLQAIRAPRLEGKTLR